MTKPTRFVPCLLFCRQQHELQQSPDDVAPREQEREAKKEWLVQQELEQGAKANKLLGTGDGSDVRVRFRHETSRLSREEIEAKQRQQSEYQAELQKQVEEKRRQREEEKRRRREEERQEELRLQREQEQMRQAREEERKKQKAKEQGQDVFDATQDVRSIIYTLALCAATLLRSFHTDTMCR